MARKDREAEKMKLWNEVFGKERPLCSTEEPELTLGDAVNQQTASVNATLKQADQAMAELNAILVRQKKNIANLSQHSKPHKEVPKADVPEPEQLAAEIQKDFGVPAQQKSQQETKDTCTIFEKVDTDLKTKIIGQEEGLQTLLTALRRPYVMGREKQSPANTILVMGPNGSGRHAAIKAAARSFYEQQVFTSEEVHMIDLSRYTAVSQEQVFLQDVYEALESRGGFICFENFEQGCPSFLRMISELVTQGAMTLSRRYVASKGVLVENRTGLVKDSISELSSPGKYLVFITEGKISDVQDAFGANFLQKIQDIVDFHVLSDEAITKIISLESNELQKKCTTYMHCDITIEPSVETWVKEHYDKTQGADGVLALFNEFYIRLSDAVMQSKCISFTIAVENDRPAAKWNTASLSLTNTKDSRREIEEVNAELSHIIGLQKVKEHIRGLQAHVAIQEKRRRQGLKTADISKHMIFTGNPGTGKTTIARLLARYLKAIGALSQGQLVEVTRADLVAQYVGQTAPLTMSVIRSALGGVLFIDEAYSLYRGKDDTFGLEAIDTLVKAMEDHRDDLVVILAGYKKEMSVFLEANSGLKSRFPTVIEFHDYTGEELVEIAKIQATNKGYKIAEDALPILKSFFDRQQTDHASEAGNGRLARNTIEDAIVAQSTRLTTMPDVALDELCKEDFKVV